MGCESSFEYTSSRMFNALRISGPADGGGPEITVSFSMPDLFLMLICVLIGSRTLTVYACKSFLVMIPFACCIVLIMLSAISPYMKCVLECNTQNYTGNLCSCLVKNVWAGVGY